jgi:hypothetical protein
LFLDQFFVVDHVVRRVFHVQLAFSVLLLLLLFDEKIFRENFKKVSQFQLFKGKVVFAQYKSSFETIDQLSHSN